MKYAALSVKQPWANLIASGRKNLEIRSWSTSYRGPLLICSSKKPAIEPFGCAVCLVDLVDIVIFDKARLRESCLESWIPGYVGWVLKNVRPVEPFPVKGNLRIFQVSTPALRFR